MTRRGNKGALIQHPGRGGMLWRLLISTCVRAASLAQPLHVRAGKVGMRSSVSGPTHRVCQLPTAA